MSLRFADSATIPGVEIVADRLPPRTPGLVDKEDDSCDEAIDFYRRVEPGLVPGGPGFAGAEGGGLADRSASAF